MTWTFTNLVIQIVAGILGGHAAAGAARVYSFGGWPHHNRRSRGSSERLLSANPCWHARHWNGQSDRAAVDQVLLQVLSGAVAGGILTLGIGLVKDATSHPRK
jgi:hypothetical protein